MEMDISEGKVDSRTGMLYPSIHVAGKLRLGGMFSMDMDISLHIKAQVYFIS